MARFWILPLVGYLGMVLGFSFLTLAIASGLYYLSELVEEHTVIAKRLLTRMIYAVIAIQTLLVLVDGFPKVLSLIGIVSHAVYLGNMRRFPVVKLSDPLFLSSCVLVLINHYYCFAHFSSLPRTPTNSIYDAPAGPTFTEIASYFGICVWLVPFALFVSLSASDNVLPTMGSEAPSGSAGPGNRQKRQGLVKVVVDGFIEWVGNAGNVLGWWKTDRRSSIL
ncbi:hypothetical protein V496_03910 [Pseudogymnoascus sp. VKM F-4515 (FW-2607)]|nr:hypothetical protein V496_03910 [Pseudogymnoascus sp. VKM F-4515 (FW-2607)]KFY95289.1 hypothetical protein V498_03428 [Pseudogymnoascus sp. VKM F-4517 (FW-2822)]